MPTLDIRTVLLTYAVNMLMCIWVAFIMWRQNRSAGDATRYWLQSFVLTFLALVLMLARGKIPDFFSIILSSLATFAAVVSLRRGLEKYAGLYSRHKLDWVLLAVFMAVQLFFTYVQPSLPARNFNYSVMLGVLFAQMAWRMLRHPDQAARANYHLVGGVLTAYALLNLVRLLLYFFISPGDNFFFSGNTDALVLVCYNILIVGLTFSLALLINQRQAATLRQDIGLLHESQDALRRSEGVFRIAFETSQDGFWVTSVAGRLLDVNSAYVHLSGYSRTELLGMSISDLEAQESQQETLAHMANIAEQGHANFETVHRRKNGGPWPVEVSVSYSPVEGGRFFVFVRDITERKSVEEISWLRANFDKLTGLPNRALLFDRLSRDCALARRNLRLVALLFLDLDGFKAINDMHGHEAGDTVLIEMARRWQVCVRSSDTVARIGGDEFAVVLGNLEHVTDAQIAAGKLIEAVQPDILLPDGRRCHVGTSVGIALYPTDALELDTMLTLADAAMYESKRHGKNTFTFSSMLTQTASQAALWVSFTAQEELGIAIMDEQHRHLVDLLNQINTALNAPGQEFSVNAMFADLIDYTAMHFATEHDLMQRYAYHDILQHNREHARLVQEIKLLVAKLQEGTQLATLQILKDWLVGHIHVSDRHLAQYLVAQGCK